MNAALLRVCVKLHAVHPCEIRDDEFVRIFHEWIRDRALPLILIDVADYTHVPEGPGVMLVSHSITFAIDRSDARLGLLAQGRRPIGGNSAEAIAETWRHALTVAAHLEGDARLKGLLTFKRENVRIEANDRLRAPNTEAAFVALEPLVRTAAEAIYPGNRATIARFVNDPRDRLALDVKVERA